MGWLPPSCVPYHYFENNSSPRGRGKQDQSPRTHPTPRLIPAWAEKTAAAPGPESQPRAHPRVGGENGISRGGLTLLGGSSPRGRGKRRMVLTTGWPVRLIPARAGKTGRQGRPAHRRPAHPRAGGENPVQRYGFSLRYGSSPRGRGKPLIAVAENHSSRLIPARAGKQNPSSGAHHLRGLIPARAGKTTRLRRCPTKRSAHPRAGGENESLVGAGVGGGSSPRGRGKPEVGLSDGVPVRLMPARAGKTERAPTSARPRPAHPRAGGENSRMITGRGMQAGSSPRGRGKRQIDTPASRRRGLIPARAGKTCRCRHPHRAAPAHPRAGGENPGAWWLPVVAGGSSPRGRGKPSVSGDGHFLSGSSPRGRGKRSGRRRRRARRGLIPARAGKTNRLARWQTSRTAHPRAGGENGIMVEQHTGELGSSPRGRGKRCVALDTPKIAGLIPARAGKVR